MPVARRRMRGERRDNGDRHADHAEQVAAPAGLRAGQAAQCQDEQHAGEQIGEPIDVSDHRLLPSAAYFFFLWYMPSMRCVTRKPPKILTQANPSAMKPKTRAQSGPTS